MKDRELMKIPLRGGSGKIGCAPANTAMLLLLLTFPLLAQTPTARVNNDEGWTITVAPYLMMPWMDGTTALHGYEVKVDVAPSEIFSNLQIGAMGYFEARRKGWGISADAMYMALGTTVDRVPLVGDRANADVDLNQGAYTFNGLRELNKNVDFLFGVRWNVLQGRLGLKGPQEMVVKQTKHWVDPFVGVKLRQSLGGRWHFAMQADIGGFGAGSTFAWHLFPMVGADVGKRATIGMGYRVLGADYKTGSGPNLFKYDVVTQGLVIGAAFHY